MGVIQRQGFKYMIVSYVGIGIGLLSTILIYPRAPELYGLFQILIGSASLCLSFFSLGFSIQAVNFFPNFQNNSNGHHGFLGYLLTGGFVGFLLFLLCLPGIRWLLIDVLFADSDSRATFIQYFNYIIPLVFILIFNLILIKYISNFHRIVIPNILDQLLIKISLPLLTLLFIGGFFTTTMFVNGVLISYVITLLGLILYTNFLGQLHLKTDFGYIKKPLAKAMANYSLYGLLNALGSQVAFRIDTLMVAGIIGITSSGVYAIVNVISDAIMKPAKGIIAISSPIISRSWKNNDLDEIRMIYKKSSVVLLTLGWLVFLGIWGSIDDLISIMENSEIIQQGKYVVLVLGLAKIIDLATSVNSEIISYSKKYQFNFYALLILAVLNIVLNLVFIPIYGLVGSAIATFCSVSIFNISKLIFIWVNFKMQPFTFTTLKILCVVGFCWSVIYFVSFNFHPIINIILRSTLLTVLYGSIILYFKISPDVNEMLYKWLKKFGW